MSELPPQLPPGQTYLERLTGRQRDVVDLVFAGKTNQQIGEALQISTKTVEKHRKAAMEKMEVTCVVLLVRLMCREHCASDATPRREEGMEVAIVG